MYINTNVTSTELNEMSESTLLLSHLSYYWGLFLWPIFCSFFMYVVVSVYICWLYNWHSCWPASQVHMLTVEQKLSLCFTIATSRNRNGRKGQGEGDCRYCFTQSSNPALEEDKWSAKRSRRFTPGVPESRCGHFGKDKKFAPLPRIESHFLGRSIGTPVTISNYIFQQT